MYIQLLDTSAPELTETMEEQLTLAQKMIQDFCDWGIQFLPKLIAGCIAFLAGWWLITIVCKGMIKALRRTKVDATVISFLNSTVHTALRIVLLIAVLHILGFDVSTLIAAIGAAAVTIGLALKDSLANVASGTLIILNKQFKIGDYLETEGLKGIVIKIDMMYTTLRTYDNKEILIPNSRLTSNNITNYFVCEERRIDLIVPISYTEDIDKARGVIRKLIDSSDRVNHERNNKIAVEKFSESSIDLMVWIWVRSDDYWNASDYFKEHIKKSLDENGISIPFNQLDIHIMDEPPKISSEKKKSAE